MLLLMWALNRWETFWKFMLDSDISLGLLPLSIRIYFSFMTLLTHVHAGLAEHNGLSCRVGTNVDGRHSMIPTSTDRKETDSRTIWIYKIVRADVLLLLPSEEFMSMTGAASPSREDDTFFFLKKLKKIYIIMINSIIIDIFCSDSLICKSYI